MPNPVHIREYDEMNLFATDADAAAQEILAANLAMETLYTPKIFTIVVVVVVIESIVLFCFLAFMKYFKN